MFVVIAIIRMHGVVNSIKSIILLSVNVRTGQRPSCNGSLSEVASGASSSLIRDSVAICTIFLRLQPRSLQDYAWWSQSENQSTMEAICDGNHH